MRLSLIVAVAENGAIGKDNKMLWHIAQDFKYFKKTTMGKPIIMGRKTYDSIGRPLPGRLNIVVTRDQTWQREGVKVVHSLEEAVEAAFAEAVVKNAEEVFLIGGSQLYEQGMDQAARIYYTEVHQSYDFDAAFPRLDQAVWAEVSREDHLGESKDQPNYSFVVFERI